MQLTKEQIEAGISPLGAYRLCQLKALGYQPPKPGQFPPKGWKTRLIGRNVTEAQYAEFLSLVIATPKKKQRHPKLFHKNEQKETNYHLARDFANNEWLTDREGFETYPPLRISK